MWRHKSVYIHSKHTLHIFRGELKVVAKDKIRQVAVMVRLTQAAEVC